MASPVSQNAATDAHEEPTAGSLYSAEVGALGRPVREFAG